MKNLILGVMLLFMNMGSQVALGNVQLYHITSFEITEGIDAMSNTAKVVIPRNYAALNGKFILDEITVGDKAIIKAGYDNELELEFTGYIREIESDYPLIIHLDDETYPLRQNNLIYSYKNATLKQVLTDIIPSEITFKCPSVNLGKFQIDNESSFQVLQRIKENYGLYSRLQNGKLTVNLRDVNTVDHDTHTYILNPGQKLTNLVRKNDLKYQRKEDYKLKVTVTSIQSDGKKLKVSVGNNLKNASQINVSYPGSYTEAELKTIATSIYNKRCYDGYTGTITGFGVPRTHAGDALIIKDNEEPDRAGKYLIEKVLINYSASKGFSRKNTLSYLII